MDFTHFLRKNQYQLASRSPQSVRSRSEDTDNMGEEVRSVIKLTVSLTWNLTCFNDPKFSDTTVQKQTRQLL